MIFSDFHCRGTMNQKPIIESIFLSCKLSGRSMAVKWVAMTKKKKNENQIFKNSLKCVGNVNSINKQLHKMLWNSVWCILPTLRSYACDLKGESFRESEISPCGFLNMAKLFSHVSNSQQWSRFFGWVCALCFLGLVTHYHKSWC